ncbi:MAG: hydrogenase iron-sulfur subunit [Armatimonadetes bacterium]|mgnify:CR=1 FL=1|nr:hydrogenase iron-sulfur subunit [Armatimonadota bacterium]HOC31630.1 hydrogenase iron-sulfur subunit [Armatimonadota bacterium]
MDNTRPPKILLITTMISSYPGANTVGQARLQYAPNTYIVRVPDPVMFPEDFFMRCFEKGFDGIIVMSSGSDCPYEGAYKRLSDRVSRVYARMRESGIDPSLLKLTTICTVCKAAFLKEINDMQANIEKQRSAQAGAPS